MGRRSLKCQGCGDNVAKKMEMFMVHDDLWNFNVPAETDLLCVGCFEKKLGRRLEPKDFKPNLPINQGCFGMSIRLADRLGYTWDDLLKLPEKVKV